jgi:hypothetical protein
MELYMILKTIKLYSCQYHDRRGISFVKFQGVAANQILARNNLTIRGEKRQEKEEKEEGYHFVERSYGSFTRSIRLPREVQSDKINVI